MWVQMIEIHEVIGRAQQGITRPFICRAKDGSIYFLKGHGASKRSLVCEWLAGQLGKSLGLPIAYFTIANVPEELIEISPRADIKELGVGFAFASKKINQTEFSFSQIKDVDQQLQRDLLAFDWWIKNGDRTLSETGGNPNLMWSNDTKSLLIFDHNLAFADDFSPKTFLESHVFAHQFSAIALDLVERDNYFRRFAKAMASWSDFCHTLPGEWLYTDQEQTIPLPLTCESIQQQLERYKLDSFWSIT